MFPSKVKDSARFWYTQYEHITAVYLLEPWEKRIINSIVLAALATTVYSTYNYLPHYSVSLLEYLGVY